MPLTGAERTRRYREKLKRENPELYAIQNKKNLERIKSKEKKIAELTEKEAKERRKVWREKKRKSRQKRGKKGVPAQDEIEIQNNNKEINQDSQNITLPLPTESQHYAKTIQRLKRSNRHYFNKCKSVIYYNRKLKTQMERNRKRHQRLQKEKEKKIKDLEIQVTKMRAREEVLEMTLKKTYQTCKKQAEKGIMKQIIQNSENKKMVTKMLGLKNRIRPKRRRQKIKIPIIAEFYMRDDISRNTAGKKETRTKKKQKVQIRYLLDTLLNTFKKYKSEGGRYGFTTFYKSKPFFVLLPGLTSRNTCLCPKHSNIDFMHDALVKHGLLSVNRKEIVKNTTCNVESYECMYNKCQICRNKKVEWSQVSEEKLNENVEYQQYKQKQHTYEKQNEVISTKRTEKTIIKESINELKNTYEEYLMSFKKHYYNNIHQQSQYRKAVEELKENECLIVCDFSESYEAKLANEVQSMHFGASKRQISLHTGMVFWKDQAQSFCTMSDDTCHQPSGIWAHLTPVINMVKEKTPNVTIIHFYTDGPSSQYRQKNNFFLLAHFTKIWGFMYCTWSFYEAHHGKSVADGIGGSVKRTLDKRVCLGTDVVDAKTACEVAEKCFTITKFFLISSSDISNITKILPSNLPVLKGTMQIHQIITDIVDEYKITYRDVSCFCGELRGHCGCFSPKSHFVIRQTKPITKNLSVVDPYLLTSGSLQNEERTTEYTCEPITPITISSNVIPNDDRMQNEERLTENTSEIVTPNVLSFIDPSTSAFLQDKGKQNTSELFEPIETEISYVDIENCSIETSVEFFGMDLQQILKHIDIPENQNESNKFSCNPVEINDPVQKVPAPEIETYIGLKPKIEKSDHLKRKIVEPMSVDSIPAAQAGMESTPKTEPKVRKRNIKTPKGYQPEFEGSATCKPKTEAPKTYALDVETRTNYIPENENAKTNAPDVETRTTWKPKTESSNVKILKIQTIYDPKKRTTCKPKTDNPKKTETPTCKPKTESSNVKVTHPKCYKCHTYILGRKIKCMGCKNWYCGECIDYCMYPDAYICEPCLEIED